MLFESNTSISLKRAFDLLAVDEKSDLAFIKQSYRRAAKLYHPDAPSGLADPDMFNDIVMAYKIILKEKKRGGRFSSSKTKLGKNSVKAKSCAKKSWWGGGSKGTRFSLFSFFKLGDGVARKKVAHPKADKSDFIEKDIRSTLSFDELVIRFDNAPSVWVRIEAAHVIYDKFRARFEAFAISRLPSTAEKAKVELIRILGMIGSPTSLNEIAPYLTSANKNLCCAAFMALDLAGAPGHSILDARLKPSSTIGYLLGSLIRGTDIEKKALHRRLISIAKLRRLRAVVRKTGFPLSDLFEGIGLTI